MKKHRHQNTASKLAGALSSSVAAGFLLLAGGGAALVATPAAAQEEEENRRPRQSQTLDPAVARVLQVVFEDINAENFEVALGKLNELINARGDRMKPYDKAITYQLRGQVNAGLENYRAALRDFQTAVDSGGLAPDSVNGVRFVIAQLYFQVQDYQAAIRSLQQWINSGGTPDANAYYLLAAAYTQIEPPNYRAAVRPAEQAVELREEPKKGDYGLLNLVYSETGERTKRAAILERMVNLWPEEGSYWRQLSGLYSSLKRDKDAFAVLEVAYRAGLLSKESEILTLVQYYSFFDNAYRGAKLLDAEMKAGIVKRNFKNLRLLSQLWSQARENKRAIAILEEAARLGEDGELYYRLGQRLLADEQYVKAERALSRARAKGGLKERQLADTWMLTGTARFSQAGPGDCDLRAGARAAFERATRYSTTAREARSWVQYIDAIDNTEEAQDRLAWQQANDERKATIERVRQQLQVCRLQGEDCTETESRLATLQDEDEKSKTPPPFGCKGKLEAAEAASSAPAAGGAAGGDVAPESEGGEDAEVKNDEAASAEGEASETQVGADQ